MIRNAAIFMSGTAASQLITLTALPLLTRLYGPGDFGTFGLFTTLLSVVGGVACLRYEHAILLPKTRSGAANVLFIALVSVVTLSTLSLFLVILFRHQFAALLGDADLVSLLWMFPLSLLGLGVYQVLHYWTSRNEGFILLSACQVARAATVSGVQLAASKFMAQGGGLVFGQLAGQWITNALLVGQLGRSQRAQLLRSIRISRLRLLAVRFLSFPKHGVPQVLLNSLTQAAPVLMLGWLFAPTTVGFYVVAQRVVAAPIVLISHSIRQVLFPQFARYLHTKAALLSPMWRQTMILAALGLPVLGGCILFGERIFVLLLGQEWREAGQYATWLVLWLWSGLFNPPATIVLTLLEKQRVQAWFEFVQLCVRVLALLTALVSEDVALTIALFSISGLICNTAIVGIATHYALRHDDAVRA